MSAPFHAELAELFREAGGRPLAQVASVSPEGLPEVRTVVLRGLADDGGPWFVSDRRSAKFRALERRPTLELCLWWAPGGVQWRLRGRARVHRNDALASRSWDALPEATRALFFSPPPGLDLADVDRSLVRGPGAAAPPDFAVVAMEPERCERLLLGPPLARTSWTRASSTWRQRELVP